MARVRLYIAPFDDTGALSLDGAGEIDNWREITKDVHMSSIDSVTEKLDRTDFETGLISVSSMSFRILNKNGYYSEVGTNYTWFKYRRKGTPFKMTFDWADFEPMLDIVKFPFRFSDEQTVFYGFLDDKQADSDIKSHSLTFQVIGREKLLSDAFVPAGLTAGVSTVSAALLLILDQAPINEHLDIDAGNFSLSYDPVLDVVSHFTGMLVKDALQELLNIGSAVAYIGADDALIISPRTESADVGWTFRGPACESGIQNVNHISKIHPGEGQVRNYITIKDSAIVSEDATSIDKNDPQPLIIDVPAITDNTKRQTIADNTKNLLRNKKQKILVEAPYNETLAALPFYTKVLVDSPALYVTGSSTGIYEVSPYNEPTTYAVPLSSFEIGSDVEWVIVGKRRTYRLDKLKIEVDLRRVS